jgi:large subunit ribosomal protein L15
MKSLENLHPAPGSNKNKKRLGRGPGSGKGGTSGKGHKGQKARKSGNVRAGFEGGQTPLYRRLPKRGFKNPSRIEYNPINLDALNVFDAGTVVTAELLAQGGLLRKPGMPVKLLGRGELTKSLTIKLHKMSGAAKAAVEKAGGKVEEI